MSFKQATLWGLALIAFFALMGALGPEQGRELNRMLVSLAVIGIVAWRIWKGQ